VRGRSRSTSWRWPKGNDLKTSVTTGPAPTADFGLGKQDLVLAFGLGLALAACRLIGTQVLYLYDDAFITFRYARNLAEGYGFVYQAGEWVLGTTTPLFGLLCAALYAARLPMPETVVALNIILDISVLVLTLAHIPPARRRSLGILWGVLWAVSPIATRVCVGAMEMNLYLAGSLAAMTLFLRGRTGFALALAAILYYIRPEALLLVAILLAWQALRRGIGNALLHGVLVGGILGLPALAIGRVYGHYLSQSVLAKSALPRAGVPDVLYRLLAYEWVLVLLLPFAIWGAIRGVAGWTFGRLVTIWITLYVVAYAAAGAHVWSWYGEPVYYGVLLLSAAGLWDVVQRLPARTGRQVSRALVLGPVLCVVVWLGLWAVQGTSGVSRKVYGRLATWCRSNETQGRSFLAYDIGALGYYSRARIYDLGGLVWPDALRYAGARQVIERYRPDYLYLNAMPENVRLVYSLPAALRYRPVTRFSRYGHTYTGPEPDRYSNVWTQDYILFEKADRSLP
jgi:hypothetical protein